ITVNTPNEIINNQNVAVKTINREYQFNIIREFGKKYSTLKCPHAQFTEAINKFVDVILSDIQLSNEYLNIPMNDNLIECSLSVHIINILSIISSLHKDKKLYEEIISKCIGLFDSNNNMNHNIILIIRLNNVEYVCVNQSTDD
ncbi:hypothetical protein EDI_039110, partial [Entamoeba dispar SAW760]